MINNAKIFRNIQYEYKSFKDYLLSFTNGEIFYETGKVSNDLSDRIANDLQKKGMKFVGTKIIYSYLQAIGIINSHEEKCFLYNNLLKSCNKN